MSPILKRLFSLLDERGVTPKQVTDQLGMSNSSFSDWKKGKGSPGVDALSKLAEYFNVSLDWLILGKTSENETKTPDTAKTLELSSSADEELLRKFHALPAEYQGKVMSYIDGMLAVIPEEGAEEQKSYA